MTFDWLELVAVILVGAAALRAIRWLSRRASDRFGP
jgi:hypothetical protein